MVELDMMHKRATAVNTYKHKNIRHIAMIMRLKAIPLEYIKK